MKTIMKRRREDCSVNSRRSYIRFPMKYECFIGLGPGETDIQAEMSVFRHQVFTVYTSLVVCLGKRAESQHDRSRIERKWNRITHQGAQQNNEQLCGNFGF
jgi:hypothetical protein